MIPPEHFDKELGAMVRNPMYSDFTVGELRKIHETLISERINADEEYQDTVDRIVVTLTVIGIIVGAAVWAILLRS